jgi:hypothetical protein
LFTWHEKAIRINVQLEGVYYHLYPIFHVSGIFQGVLSSRWYLENRPKGVSEVLD